MAEHDLASLKRLPRRAREVWQVGLVRLPAWVTEPGKEPFRPWAGFWLSLGPGFVHTGPVAPPAERRPEQALETLVKAALDPAIGGYLPGRLEVTGPGVAPLLESALAPLGVTVVARDRLAALDAMLHRMAEGLHDHAVLPGVLSAPGVTLERLAAFAEAARLFYEAAPWKHLTDQDLIRIEEPRGPVEHRHALVLGAAGQEYGLLLFEDAAFHEGLMGDEDTLGVFERTVHDAVYFDDITGLPLEDSAIFEDHRLPVAGPNAYPWAVRLGPGHRVQRLSLRALAHAEAVLRALAATPEEEIDRGRWTRIVPAAEGAVTVRLSLPGLLDEPSGRPGGSGGGARGNPGPIRDWRVTERANAEIFRALAAEPPASIEEANAILAKRFGGKPLQEIPSTASTPLEKAQDLCYQAFDARGRRRIRFAREALSISPDCADAYLILAEQSGDPEQAIRFFREAVAAGERALGRERLASEAPFWSDIRTRPYMRALEGLAAACAAQGRTHEAIELFQRLLTLNPNDNQGVRDPLAGLLLKIGDHDALQALADRYDSKYEVTLLYARALLLFRKEGNSAGSLKALRRALQSNRHVPRVLLGDAPAGPLPSAYAMGSMEQAIYCASLIGDAWEETDGALDWLRRQTGKS